MDTSLSKLWKVVKDRKPGVLQSMGSQITGNDLSDNSNRGHKKDAVLWPAQPKADGTFRKGG